MQVVFPAVLDLALCDDRECVCRRCLALGLRSDQEGGGRPRVRPGEVVFPNAMIERALVRGAAVLAAGGDPGGEPSAGPSLPGVFAIATPAGVELAFNTLCPEVRRLLAANEEPIAVGRAEGGWRRPLAVFAPREGIERVRLLPRVSLPWTDFAALREAALDAIADRRQPLLARLAVVGSLVAKAVEERRLPPSLPVLTARNFLAFRGFLEARIAAAEPEALAAFAASVLPLFGPGLGLTAGQVPDLLDALAGDWRAHFRSRLVGAERSLWPAFEAFVGARVQATPLDRDLSLARGYAELFEGLAVGLRYAAALAEVMDRDVDGEVLVAALALGEHYVAGAGAALPSFTLPTDQHERGPRMADLDMTMESIC
jgi:hypothetical protein